MHTAARPRVRSWAVPVRLTPESWFFHTPAAGTDAPLVCDREALGYSRS